MSVSSCGFADLKLYCENLVQKRRISEFQKLFQRYHKQFHKSPNDFREACEWLRRLGLFRVGLRFCGFSYHAPLDSHQMTDPLQPQKIFWTARFLWALGCQQYALQLFSDIRRLAPEDYKALADIYQTQGLFHKAIESLNIYLTKACLIHFVVENDKMTLTKERSSLSYTARMTLISLADAYAGLGQFLSAFSILDQVEKFSQQSTPSFEPLVLGICRQARAEYLCQINKFDSALDEILKAETLFIQNDESLDYVFFIKWKAYILSQVGGEKNAELAKEHFRKGRNLLNRKNVRPEVMIDYLRLETTSKQALSRAVKSSMFKPAKSKNTAPDLTLLRLSWYPGLADEYRKRNFQNLPKELVLTTKKVKYRAYLSSREFHDISGDKRSAHIPLELELAGWVKVCGEIGLPVYRSFELLWPTEVNSFFELENRIKSLIQRCRKKYGLQLKMKNKILSLSENSPIEVYLHTSNVPTFLQNREAFQSTELDQYYNLKSRSQRSQLIKYWIENNWIETIGANQKKGYSYKVLSRKG